MKEKKIEEIGRKLSVFSFGRLQELVTLFGVLEREGISFEDVKEFVASSLELYEVKQARFERMARERKNLWDKRTRKCPSCKKPLALRPITTPRGRGNVEGYTCLWYCLEEDCTFEEYSKEDFQKTYMKVMGGR